MIDNYEFGYTPNNLKALRQKYGLSQREVADLLGIDISSLQRWEADVGQKSHRDMPLPKWLELVDILNGKIL
jgi:XRE family transcriptional regulator